MHIQLPVQRASGGGCKDRSIQGHHGRLFQNTVNQTKYVVSVKNVRNVSVSECESLKLIDVGGAAPFSGGQSRVSEEIQCRPLGLLFLGLLDTAAQGEAPLPKPGTDCWAVYGEDDISLQIRRHDSNLRLESSFSGNNATDYIFLYSRNSFDLDRICPIRSWMEQTGMGTMAWIDGIPSEQLEQHLIQLGSALLRQA